LKPFAYLIALIFLFSCQQANKKITEAEFSINKLLLSDSSFKSNKGFFISPPKRWFKTGSYDSVLRAKTSIRSDNKLLAIYKSDTADCALIITELPEATFSVVRGSLNKTDSYPGKDTIWTNVQSSIFKYKSFEIIQFVLQNSELVVFKLFAHRSSELYEMDYIIPRNEINKYLQSVESSIGSIN
jgi:hypothetical protein